MDLGDRHRNHPKLRPLGDRVVVQPPAREEMTKSGIVLPDTAKEKPQEGKILAVGPGRTLDNGEREAIDVKEGERVLYAKYAGTEFKVESEELLIISEKDILAQSLGERPGVSAFSAAHRIDTCTHRRRDILMDGTWRITIG